MTRESVAVPRQQAIDDLFLKRGQEVDVNESGVEVQPVRNADNSITQPNGKIPSQCSNGWKSSTRFKSILPKTSGKSTGKLDSA
ncbi:MAG: hypothetical protein WA477_24965 [Candidatus Sulfotelmatobacter sp.]